MTEYFKKLYNAGLLLLLGTLCCTKWHPSAFTLHTAHDVTVNGLPMMNDEIPVSHGYSLLRSDVRRQHLRVVRGRSAPLQRVHLPIQIRAQKGQVCRVEVEEFQPLLSMVGYLEPKKFDCSFTDGEVTYHHQGNPLTNHDHVQVTISFFRNNNSVVQTVDIMVDVEDPPNDPGSDASVHFLQVHDNNTRATTDGVGQTERQKRFELLNSINVTNLKSTSDSITPEVLRFYYDPTSEECHLSYTSPDYGEEPEDSSKWLQQTSSSLAGTRSPRLGLPLAAGDAVGGMHRWPLFGQLVAFNRSAVHFFDLDCQEALLQGYRYMHRKPNSPDIDFVPMQVVIWRREPDGTRTQLWREGIFLKVLIVNGQPLKLPLARIFRQVNVTHIGGSLSILPRDSVSIPQDAVPGMEYLDVNMTQMQGPLQAQIVNMRDPTRPVTSFRLLDLRRGLIALQLLNYAESLVKVFVITLTVVDPFFQVSEPVNLRIATFLQPVVHVGVHSPHLPRAPSFQVFSLPLFTYTGAISLVQKHNIQVVGYIDESMVVYSVQPWLLTSDLSRKPDSGSLRLDGEAYSDLIFGPLHIAVMRLTYVHSGGYEPTVERIPLTVSVPSLTNRKQLLRKKRYLNKSATTVPFNSIRRNTGRRHRSHKRSGHRKRTIRSRMRYDPAPETQLELSVRIVRLYDKVVNGALKPGVLLRLAALTHVCFTSEDLLTPEALQAIRSDLVNLEFTIKVAPSQGSLVRRMLVDSVPEHGTFSTGKNEAGLVDSDWSTTTGMETDRLKIQQLLETTAITKITVEDLEAGDICYRNHKNDRSTDLIGIKQLGRQDFPTFYMNIEILPPNPLVIEQRMDPNVLVRVRETATHVVISSLHLNHALKWGPPTQQPNTANASYTTPKHFGPEDVVYRLVTVPRFASFETSSANHTRYSTHDAGRLISLKAVTASTHVGDMNLRPALSTSLREAQAPCVVQFTQQQIDMGDIVYVPPAADIGVSDKFVITHYMVIGPGGVRLLTRQMRILIVAEDNQTPKIEIVKPLEVQRDGELILGPEVLSISDVDTTVEQLTIRFDRLPRYGDIWLSTSASKNGNHSLSVPVGVGQNLPISFFYEERICYKQSGANVKSDEFILTATDPKQSSQPLLVGLQIKPRILHESKWNQMANTSVLIEENGTLTLQPAVFPDVDTSTADTSGPQYFLIVFPTKGHLEIGKNQRVSQFSHTDVSKGRLVYRHGPAEIGLKPVFDFARIWDFNAGTTFSLNFTLIPVNSQPPVVRAEAPVQVKEGDISMIDQYTLHASDPDTAEEDIQLQVIHPPRWGHIGIAPENVGGRSVSHVGAELNQTLSFSMQAIKDGRVFYVNSLHGGGQESLADVFTVRAFDGKFYSPHTVEVTIAIQPTNDEIPDVRLLKHFSVTVGSRRILTPYLFSVSDKDVPRDMLQIQFTQLPIYGNLTVFWQHGERYILSKDSPPITESYLGMMNLLYIQNSSILSTQLNTPNESLTEGGITLATDRFTVSVSDGAHVVEKQANILIRSANRYPPEMTVDASTPNGLTLEGVAWTTLDKKPGGLVIQDRDTSPDDLIVTLVEAPKYGIIQRLPRLDGPDGVDVLDLTEDAWDMEEMGVGENPQELARLSVAGSVGGPKAVKILRQGDRFTKRQLDAERIHYVYTGSYSEQTVYDSCVVRLSDGDYDTAAVTLRFQIRRTTDRAGLQSLRYSPSDPLRLHSRPPSGIVVPKMDEVSLASAAYEDDKYVQHQMDQSELVDSAGMAIVLPAWDACVEQYSFLSYYLFHSIVSGQNVTSAPNDIFLSANISIPDSPNINLTFVGRMQQTVCGFFVNARRPQQPISRFTTDDLNSRLIAFSASGCKDRIDQTVNVLLRIDFGSTRGTISAVLPIRFTKRCRQLPRLKRVQPNLEILPGTDVVLSREHLEFVDPDSDPTRLVYVIRDPFTTGSTHTFGGLQVTGVGASQFFTQYQVNSGQVYFRTNKQLSVHSTTAQQLIEINLFDAGDFDDVTNVTEMFQVANDALNTLQHFGIAEVNPYNERMQYVADTDSRVISIKPILLHFSPSPLLQKLHSTSHFIMVINRPPSPTALETIVPGIVGFRLTSANLYSSKSDAMYRLVGVLNGKGELFHITLNRSVSSFVQEDVGRRRIAFVFVSKSRWHHPHSKHNQKRPRNLMTGEILQFNVYDPNEPHENLHIRMTLQWMEIGIIRRVYRVCGTRGLLRVGVERFGAADVVKNFSSDVYVGLKSSTAAEGLDFSLHSPKTVVFEKGETKKSVLIRVNIRNGSPKTTHEIVISLKSPTGAILSPKRQAKVVIGGSPKCKDRSYFSPQKHENPVKRDLEQSAGKSWSAYLRVADGVLADDSGGIQPNTSNTKPLGESSLTEAKTPISLKEWLATNKLPDSQTLSASYHEFMQKRQTSRCLEGWMYYQNRCYRWFAKPYITWKEAEIECQSHDAFLTSIHNDAHANWLSATYRPDGPYWIGLHQPKPWAGWAWHNLERVDFTKWKRGFPVNTRWMEHLRRKRSLYLANPWKAPTGQMMQFHPTDPHQAIRATFEREGRRHSERQRSKRSPRVCVLVNPLQFWQNRPCDRPIGVGFICMRNPEA